MPEGFVGEVVQQAAHPAAGFERQRRGPVVGLVLQEPLAPQRVEVGGLPPGGRAASAEASFQEVDLLRVGVDQVLDDPLPVGPSASLGLELRLRPSSLVLAFLVNCLDELLRRSLDLFDFVLRVDEFRVVELVRTVDQSLERCWLVARLLGESTARGPS